MENKEQKNVEGESFDLGEKPYGSIPDSIERHNSFECGRYEVKIWDLAEWLETYDGGKSIYHVKGKLMMTGGRHSSEQGSWEYGGSTKLGGGSYGHPNQPWNLDDTAQAAKLYASGAHEYLKETENIWVDPDKVEAFVYDALEPVRQRRRDLAERVMGVGFGKLEEGNE